MEKIYMQLPDNLPDAEEQRERILLPVYKKYIEDNVLPYYVRVADITKVILDSSVLFAGMELTTTYFPTKIGGSISFCFALAALVEVGRKWWRWDDDIQKKVSPYLKNYIDGDWEYIAERWHPCKWHFNEIASHFKESPGKRLQEDRLPYENLPRALHVTFGIEGAIAGVRASIAVRAFKKISWMIPTP